VFVSTGTAGHNLQVETDDAARRRPSVRGAWVNGRFEVSVNVTATSGDAPQTPNTSSA